MKYEEIYDDLFNKSIYENGSWYVQCISADLRMGRGIAEQFNDHFDMKHKLMEKYELDYTAKAFKKQGAEVIFCPGVPVFNLITKEHYWDKPTLSSMTEALKLLKFYCEAYDIKRLLMPKIGCGLDKLEWKDVKRIIFKIFDKSDIEIVVCKLREVI